MTEPSGSEASGRPPHPSVAAQNALASSEARDSGVPGVGVEIPDAEVLHPSRNAKSNAGAHRLP